MPGKEYQLCSECISGSVQNAGNVVNLKSDYPDCFDWGRMLNYPYAIISQVINGTDKPKGQITSPICRWSLACFGGEHLNKGCQCPYFCAGPSHQLQQLLFFTVHPLLASVIESAQRKGVYTYERILYSILFFKCEIEDCAHGSMLLRKSMGSHHCRK